ncbi:hypothetical protein ASG82_12950 [Mycobacterium sp. Soil538]|nr:hypothetical protein ASG82_12950 [Mycobacterium sp. Soil538]
MRRLDQRPSPRVRCRARVGQGAGAWLVGREAWAAATKARRWGQSPQARAQQRRRRTLRYRWRRQRPHQGEVPMLRLFD